MRINSPSSHPFITSRIATHRYHFASRLSTARYIRCFQRVLLSYTWNILLLSIILMISRSFSNKIWMSSCISNSFACSLLRLSLHRVSDRERESTVCLTTETTVSRKCTCTWPDEEDGGEWKWRLTVWFDVTHSAPCGRGAKVTWLVCRTIVKLAASTAHRWVVQWAHAML